MRMKRLFRVGMHSLAPVLATAGMLGSFAHADDDAPDQMAVIADGAIVQVLVYTAIEFESIPGYENLDRFGSTTSLRGHFPKPLAARMPTRDPWNSRYYYLIPPGAREIGLISFGADGKPDLDYAAAVSGDTQKVLQLQLESGLYDDLLVYSGKLVTRDSLMEGRARRTLADMRSLATVMEAYSVDNDAYPEQRTLDHVQAIRHLMEPIYIRTAPLNDGWDTEFWYWSDGDSYILISYGADRLAERNYGALENPAADVPKLGMRESLDADLVFVNGSFVSWWETSER